MNKFSVVVKELIEFNHKQVSKVLEGFSSNPILYIDEFASVNKIMIPVNFEFAIHL